MEPLTKKQSEVLNYVLDTIREEGYSPSYDEIARHFGLASKATVAEHLATLQAKGYLKLPGNKEGSLTPARGVMDLVQAVSLPLTGLITAGKPIEAIQTDERLAVPPELVADPHNTYVLRVQGRSMVEEGILDGDYVIVQRNPSPRNGDVVVALLKNEYATLKKFYREPDRIRLQPANVTMDPIYVKDVIVQGVVRGLIRKFKTI